MRRRTFLAATGGAAMGARLSPVHANAPRPTPFLGSWMNLHHLYHKVTGKAQRYEAIDRALDGHVAAGLETVMPFITSTSGLAHFPSRVMKSGRKMDWDPLEYLVKGAGKRDLDVYPAFCSLVCGHQEPAGVLREHPEWASRHPDGKPMGHICPTHPEARDWLTAVIADVVKRYPAKGIMLDYLRYYNRPSRLDSTSEKMFLASQKDRTVPAQKEALQRYREEGITKLARQISTTVRGLNPALKVAIYSWGPHVAQGHQVAQPWPTWCRDKLVDHVSVSGYCYPDNYGQDYLQVFGRRIGDAIKLNRTNGNRARMTFSLGVVTSHGKIRNASWIQEYLGRALEEGVSGVTVFTWGHLQPYLKQTIERGYFPRFRQRLLR